MVPLTMFLFVCFMSHIMLTHHVRSMFFFQLCCHSNTSILEKRNSICTKTNKLKSRYFSVGQTSLYCTRDLVIITRVKLFAFLPLTCYNVKRIGIIFHAYIICTHALRSMTGLSIIIISLHLKK